MGTLKQITQSWFSFNRRERNGILFLLGILLLLFITAIVQPLFYKLPEADFAAFDNMAASMKEIAAEKKENPKYAVSEKDDQAHIHSRHEAVKHYTLKTEALFYFNPNNLEAEKWMQLGLSPVQAQSIKKYEAKGGRFRTKEDVRKMYVISPAFYDHIEKYIVIPDEQQVAARPVIKDIEQTNNSRNVIVDLNEADTTALQSLPGIGSVFARRIISYRQRLGGFHSTGQLLEVYGFDAERLDRIRNQVKLNVDFLRRYNVNIADVNELKTHPYITPAIATAIVSYRKTHGPFKTVEGIRQVDLVNADLYLKLAPYLTR